MHLHQNLVLFSAALQAVSGQTSCNNSPSLCSRHYDNITYLGAHNSPFSERLIHGFLHVWQSVLLHDETTRRWSAASQPHKYKQTPRDSTTLHVCHTSCALLDAGTLSSWLSEIKTWMDAHPNDVVTILLVNGADATASDLADAYTKTPVSSIWPIRRLHHSELQIAGRP